MVDRTSMALQKEMGAAPRSEDGESESGAEEGGAGSSAEREASPAPSSEGRKATVEDAKSETGDYEDVAL